jgi:hypothetical protein
VAPGGATGQIVIGFGESLLVLIRVRTRVQNVPNKLGDHRS